MTAIDRPWLKFYGDVPHNLDYPDTTMYEEIAKNVISYPSNAALNFYGKITTFKELVKGIDTVAKALRAYQIEPGDKVTICMPNCPQAVMMFYALNKIGAIPNMVHPLSAEQEITFYVNFSKSVAVLTLDQFVPKFESILQDINVKHIIVAKIADELPAIKGIAYSLMNRKKVKPVKSHGVFVTWKEFIGKAKTVKEDFKANTSGKDAAAILYSGGTTGTTKGIVLSNLNFNALGLQTAAASEVFEAGDKMLAIMPIFHGFGLGVCVHTVLMNGSTCILIPQFSIKDYPSQLKQYKPNFIAGVPTLWEALLKSDKMDDVDLSCLKGIFSGGDSLSVELKRKVDIFLKEHGSDEQIREGFGLTECVTASCLTPRRYNREGSIGVPFPDTYYKIVKPYTHEEQPYGEEGEIVISGPTVMMEYMDNPKETHNCLQQHEDGMLWMHTGDIGYMDEDGFVYFKNRLKRMIVSSGYNIYPGQLENIIDEHEAVLYSTCIGVRDSYKGQKIKAFVVLQPGVPQSEETRNSIREHCKKRIAKYAMPYEFEFRNELPKTLVGKVAFNKLEQEEEEKLKQQGK
ncbi:MAG: AMP-binding protein [Erysipelotrichaceae bacterium]|nr:AMP-binding protein [Erysipelotrichaceae bacterium]